MITTHQPKGSMCINCKRRAEDCSKLDFAAMKPLSTYNSVVIVKCAEFRHEKTTV